MGYVREKTFRLVWPDDSDLAGLEVRIRTMTMDQALGLLDDPAPDRAAQRDATLRSLQEIADSIVSWNLEQPGGQPVPATLDGLRRQDPELIVAIRRAWIDAVMAVPAPLGKPSPAGEQSLEESIPMESPSENQPSSNGPN